MTRHILALNVYGMSFAVLLHPRWKSDLGKQSRDLLLCLCIDFAALLVAFNEPTPAADDILSAILKLSCLASSSTCKKSEASLQSIRLI